MNKTLSENQTKKKYFFELQFNVCYVELHIRPSIARRIACWFTGDNPHYKILDPRNIRLSQGSTKDRYSVVDDLMEPDLISFESRIHQPNKPLENETPPGQENDYWRDKIHTDLAHQF